ncbi:MAG TPA: hypothetical protein VMF90_14055 [Rhizobiaceae bacterium]|nr:hypothetical protein [Rhizobiaceae bacterium]
MSPFIFPAVLALTIASGSTAALIAVIRKPRPGSAQAVVVERLAQIAVIGAAAIAALLGG